MEVEGIPRYPIESVEDIGIGIVPCPVSKLNGRNVVRYIDQDRAQANCFRMKI